MATTCHSFGPMGPTTELRECFSARICPRGCNTTYSNRSRLAPDQIAEQKVFAKKTTESSIQPIKRLGERAERSNSRFAAAAAKELS